MKKPRSTRKKNVAGAVAAVVVVTAISAGVIFYFNNQRQSESTTHWITSGPFAISNSTFRLGDNIFMTVTGLKPSDIGKIVVHDPKGGVFTQAPFNGTEKADFNFYFKPDTEKTEKLCTPQDLVGNWTIDFVGTSYQSLSFRVLNEWVA